MAGGCHGKGRAQIARGIRQHIRQGKLGAGEHHGQVDVRQHEGDGGGGIGHGVGAVGDHNAVETRPILKNPPGDELPFRRADVGGIQTDHVVHGDIVIGAQLV